ncbi:kinase-like domain-containing protein [Lophiotrema nucula]|uniref:Kinase-like domain-containing protein n=1 Tax=Lophiotrema nucula TaxID=690887 RepID=A0A6A5ZM64_9PLEO|nr:kinase-like domain-containing protein [Lophiotrema nucula]
MTNRLSNPTKMGGVSIRWLKGTGQIRKESSKIGSLVRKSCCSHCLQGPPYLLRASGHSLLPCEGPDLSDEALEGDKMKDITFAMTLEAQELKAEVKMTSHRKVTSAPPYKASGVVSTSRSEVSEFVEDVAAQGAQHQSGIRRAVSSTGASSDPRKQTEIKRLATPIGLDNSDASLESTNRVEGSEPTSAPLSPEVPAANLATSKENFSLAELANALRVARIQSADEADRFFIPNSDLEHIVTGEVVSAILSSLGIGTATEKGWLTTATLKTPDERKGQASRRKIFAILILLENVKPILDFISQDIFDHDLPFGFSETETKVFRRDRADPVTLFESWTYNDRFLFDSMQWWMCSPYLRLNCINHPRITRYVVEDRAIMPFINEESPSRQPPWNEGGFSVVKKIRFHPTHYNWEDFCATKENNPNFAIKTIKIPIDEGAQPLYNREVESLIRLNGEEHDHLIRLLATFQHKKQLHLIFAWADGNLQEFWRNSTRDGEAPSHSVDLARWMAQQCLGLASGLKAIHHNPIEKSQAQEQGMQPDAPHKHRGRHGDLKPENILWFLSAEESTYGLPVDTLKISDFGFADFHASISASRIPLTDLGFTMTYRAPEWDVRGNTAPAYDIWSIGCVYLEFVEWYLCGYNGVERFSQHRLEDSVNELPYYTEDNFFNRKKMAHDEKIAILKEAVPKEIHALRQLPYCSEYVLDFLDYIEDTLLRMKPEGRHGCDALVAKLQELYEECKADASYCTERKRPARKQKTFLSEIVHLSPQQKHGFSAMSNQAISEDGDDSEDQTQAVNSGLGIDTQGERRSSDINKDHAMPSDHEPAVDSSARSPIAAVVDTLPSPSLPESSRHPALLRTEAPNSQDARVRPNKEEEQVRSTLAKSAAVAENGAHRSGQRGMKKLETENGKDPIDPTAMDTDVATKQRTRQRLWNSVKRSLKSILRCLRSER